MLNSLKSLKELVFTKVCISCAAPEYWLCPSCLSAWNTSVQGHKRWLLIPPHPDIDKNFVRGKHLMKKGEDDEAIQYFDFILPRLKKAEGPEIGRAHV